MTLLLQRYEFSSRFYDIYHKSCDCFYKRYCIFINNRYDRLAEVV